MPSHKTVAADIRAWRFEATIVGLDDSEDLFGDVRLGDTIRGDFAYDLAMEPLWSDTGINGYDFPDGFRGIRLTIENPRTGGELRYELGPDTWLYVEAATDESFYEQSSLLLWQYAEAPSPGLWPAPFIAFHGTEILAEPLLPEELHLEDWHTAAIFLGGENTNDGVTAQIYLLEQLSSGDFNQDGNVDVGDLSQWQVDYSLHGTSDADRDGDSDGLDFLSWQRNIGSSVALASSVPEANSLSIVVLMSVCGLAKRGRSFRQ